MRLDKKKLNPFKQERRDEKKLETDLKVFKKLFGKKKKGKKK